MSNKSPWKILDRIDGGGPGSVQGRGRARRGIKFAPSGNIPMPGWMRNDIADVTSAMGGVHPGQVQETDDKDVPDTRTPLEKKYDIREIDGRRVAHVTPEKFRDIMIANRGLRGCRQHVSKMVISDGANLSAEFKFANAYPAPLNVGTRLMLTALVRHGIVGALGSDRVALILDGQQKELGYLIRGDVSPELAAHGQLVSGSHLQSVSRHRTGGNQYQGNISDIFKNAAILKDILDQNPRGVALTKDQKMHDGRVKTISLGSVFPYTDDHSRGPCLYHVSAQDFRDHWAFKFATVARVKTDLTVPDLNWVETPVGDVRDVFIYPRIDWRIGPRGKPIGVFIPAAYLPPSFQSPDPTL